LGIESKFGDHRYLPPGSKDQKKSSRDSIFGMILPCGFLCLLPNNIPLCTLPWLLSILKERERGRQTNGVAGGMRNPSEMPVRV
jgi:hypothetical protein